MLKTAVFLALVGAVFVFGQVEDVAFRPGIRPNPTWCLEPMDVGPCEAVIPRYFYDSVRRQCRTFNWGGCQENGNNFLTLEHCQEFCERNLCLEPLKVGPCKARFPRHYFNTTSKQCEQFFWGGCQANRNNFLTLPDCQDNCPVGSCWYEGRWHADGTKVSTNPCVPCRCNQGRVSCAYYRCSLPDCPNPTVPPGECCATCPAQEV